MAPAEAGPAEAASWRKSLRRDRAHGVIWLRSGSASNRPYFATLARPNSLDFAPSAAVANPSATSPRFMSSRIAEARLGMRFANRQLSTSFISGRVSMILQAFGPL
jgi:hypothetical protein